MDDQVKNHSNLTDLRSLIGLVNRFTVSAPDLKQAMAPRQGSLKKSKVFTWGLLHNKALATVKEIITNLAGQVLKHFQQDLPIQLLTDASRTGIGYCLVQTETNNKNANPLLITSGSWFLSTAEKNYAVIKLKLLVIAVG